MWRQGDPICTLGDQFHHKHLLYLLEAAVLENNAALDRFDWTGVMTDLAAQAAWFGDCWAKGIAPLPQGDDIVFDQPALFHAHAYRAGYLVTQAIQAHVAGRPAAAWLALIDAQEHVRAQLACLQAMEGDRAWRELYVFDGQTNVRASLAMIEHYAAFLRIRYAGFKLHINWTKQYNLHQGDKWLAASSAIGVLEDDLAQRLRHYLPVEERIDLTDGVIPTLANIYSLAQLSFCQVRTQSGLSGARRSMSEQPHILFISSDQHRADFLGCAGHPIVRTPHLDQLAREGTHFRRASSECPVCIPARTGLITGIHPARYGMPSYADQFRFDRPRELLLGSLLTQAGYQTALVGKRHWHREPTCTGGFETVIPIERCKRAQSLASDGWGFPTGCGANELSPSAFPLDQSLYSTNWITDRSCEILAERDQTRPLAMWCSFVDPHPPIAIHEPYYSMYQGKEFLPLRSVHGLLMMPVRARHQMHHQAWGGRLQEDERQAALAVYSGMITNLDHQLGRIFGMLDHWAYWKTR